MAESTWQVRDELWEVVEPLLPEQGDNPRGGRPRVDDRVAFGAIVFVLITGIAWRHLPSQLGCSPATPHRRLQQWQRAGVFARLHRELSLQLNRAGRIDWATAAIDATYGPCKGGCHRPLACRPRTHRLQASLAE